MTESRHRLTFFAVFTALGTQKTKQRGSGANRKVAEILTLPRKDELKREKEGKVREKKGKK